MNVSFSAVSYATLGGVFIGSSAAILLAINGKIAGISGIAGNYLQKLNDKNEQWRGAFLAGMLAGGVIMQSFAPWTFDFSGEHLAGASYWPFLLTGLLVGFGTRLGNGCTSGHGICGLGRMSIRSLSAVMMFMATGMATTYIIRHVLQIPGW